MNKLLRSCIIIFGAFFILAVTKSASSQSVEFGISTPVISFVLDKGPHNGYGTERHGYNSFGNQRYERHDYDRDDHYRGDRDDYYRGDRDRGDRYEKHYEKPVKHEKANYKHRG